MQISTSCSGKISFSIKLFHQYNAKQKLKLWFSHLTKSTGCTRHLNPIPLQHSTISIENSVMLCIWDDTIKHSVSVSASYHSNPKRFWRWINLVKRFRTPIPPLSHTGHNISDDAEKANVFNQYFCSVFTKEVYHTLMTLNQKSHQLLLLIQLQFHLMMLLNNWHL